MGGMGQQGFNGVNQYGMMQQQQQTRGSGSTNFGPVGMNNGGMMPVSMNNMVAGNNPGAGGMMMNNGAPMGSNSFQQNGMNKMTSSSSSSSSMQQVSQQFHSKLKMHISLLKNSISTDEFQLIGSVWLRRPARYEQPDVPRPARSLS